MPSFDHTSDADQMGEKTHVIRAENAFEFKHTLSHPWNPDTLVPGTQLARLVGLQRTRQTLIQNLPPGLDRFTWRGRASYRLYR